MSVKACRSRSAGRSICVFDLGKTNKKLLVFDEDLRIVDSIYETFDATEKDGLYVEATEATADWLLAGLQSLASRHDIGVISIAAHGAAFACLDSRCRLALPVLSYTSDPGPDFHQAFQTRFGDPRSFQARMATPDIPGLGCMAKGIYFVQTRFSQRFADTRALLPLPQYYGFLLTGKKGIEQTYLANHTGLWNFHDGSWSEVAVALGVTDLFPAVISKPWDFLGAVTPAVAEKTGLRPDTAVTVGIHDSNAALLPYLIQTKGDFVLNSTGSVCVAMHPTDTVHLSEDELGKVVFYNLSAFSQPVKTSIFLAGIEFDTYMGLLKSRHGDRPYPALDVALLDDILAAGREFLLPSLVPFGMFPDSPARAVEDGRTYPLMEMFVGKTPSFFNDPGRAYAILNLSLAIQTQVALERAGWEEGTEIYIEGGFRKNEVYTRILASLFPNVRTTVTNLEEASAFGAALVGKAALENCSPERLADLFEIETKRVSPLNLPGLETYRAEFFRLVTMA